MTTTVKYNISQNRDNKGNKFYLAWYCNVSTSHIGNGRYTPVRNIAVELLYILDDYIIL